MGKRSRRRRQRRKHEPETPARANEDALCQHPLGIYGTDWDDDYAFIAGFTGWGYPYGVPWAQADWLEDDPEFGEWVREAREEADRWAASEQVTHDDALGVRRDLSPDDEIPF